MPSQMLSASVMACEMRWPWCSEKLRARRPYLVLSREVCLAATREPVVAGYELVGVQVASEREPVISSSPPSSNGCWRQRRCGWSSLCIWVGRPRKQTAPCRAGHRLSPRPPLPMIRGPRARWDRSIFDTAALSAATPIGESASPPVPKLAEVETPDAGGASKHKGRDCWPVRGLPGQRADARPGLVWSPVRLRELHIRRLVQRARLPRLPNHVRSS